MNGRSRADACPRLLVPRQHTEGKSLLRTPPRDWPCVDILPGKLPVSGHVVELSERALHRFQLLVEALTRFGPAEQARKEHARIAQLLHGNPQLVSLGRTDVLHPFALLDNFLGAHAEDL